MRRPPARMAAALAAAAALALPVAAAPPQPPEAPQALRGEALHAALLGVWCNSDDGGRSCWAWDHLRADGRLRACGRHADGQAFDGEGPVTVDGDRLCYRVERASPGFWLATGQRYCTRIVAVASDHHDYEDLDTGRRFRLIRRPEAEMHCPPPTR